jgi:site-specific DNA-methyltransferase (adenine-specific)
MERLILPFTDVDDWVLDPFMGTGTTGVVCKQTQRNFVGIESNEKIFTLAKKRIDEYPVS